MSKEKIYIGAGKKANDKGTWLKATINMAKFEDHIQEFKGHKFLKLNINIYDEDDQYGKNVKITIDDFEPDGASNRVKQATAVPKEITKKVIEEEEDDLPF